MNELPTISILIPTLNAASVLEKCLRSIVIQDYPRDKIEIIIADGGSKDKTLDIAKKYGARIYENPLKTGEAGKAVALRHAQGELVAFVDSDNVLPERNWLKTMIEPFSDREIVGSEPWEFTYRQKDGFIDRYCALMGMNDPLCYFLGNYDRRNILSGKWTELPIKQEDNGGWIKVTLRRGAIPTVGANGTVLRREVLTGSNSVGDYLFDIDVIAKLASKKAVKFAKVKKGIVHLYCGRDMGKFVRKQKRRIRDYLYYRKNGLRKYPWQKQGGLGLLKFIFSCIFLVPLLWQAVKGYLKKSDSAWFFHPLACELTFVFYAIGVFSSIISNKTASRALWRQ